MPWALNFFTLDARRVVRQCQKGAGNETSEIETFRRVKKKGDDAII